MAAGLEVRALGVVKMKRSRFFERVLTGLVVVMALIGILGTVGVTSAYADDVATAPQYTKSLKTNDDGTYTLSLSVTGKSSSSSSTGKADVIVVLDTSGSMSDSETGTTPSYVKVDRGHQDDSYVLLVNGEYVKLTYSNRSRSYSYTDSNGRTQTYSGTRYYQTYTRSRLSIAQEAVDKLAKQLLANNTSDNTDAVQLSLVTFASTAEAATTPTTDLGLFVTSSG